jgi:hypothetical protein
MWSCLKISKKTDVLSLATFLIGLGGIFYQLTGFFNGPEIKLFPPKKVLLFPVCIEPQGLFALNFFAVARSSDPPNPPSLNNCRTIPSHQSLNNERPHVV